MSTPYAEIYEDFIFKIKAYQIAGMLQEDREFVIGKYMKSVCRKFNDVCRVDLYDVDEAFAKFNATLSQREIDIISEGMVTEWLKPLYFSDELIESRLNLKDYTEFSPAKLIEQVRQVYTDSRDRSKQLIVDYTYSFWDIADINKKKKGSSSDSYQKKLENKHKSEMKRLEYEYVDDVDIPPPVRDMNDDDHPKPPRRDDYQLDCIKDI